MSLMREILPTKVICTMELTVALIEKTHSVRAFLVIKIKNKYKILIYNEYCPPKKTNESYSHDKTCGGVNGVRDAQDWITAKLILYLKTKIQ